MKKSILVPTDFTKKSLKTIEQSYLLAKIFDVDVTLLHVRQDTKKTLFFSMFSEQETQEMKKKYIDSLHLKLKTIADEALKKHNIKVNTMLSKGRVFEKVIEISEAINAELILLDKNTAEGNPENYIGTNTSRILRYTQCPVLILNNFDVSKGFKNIILPLDLSKETRQKVNKAIELAKICNSTIKIMSGLLSEQNYVLNHLQTQLKQVDKFVKESQVSCTSELIKSDKSINKLPGLIFDYAKNNEGDLIMLMTQQEVGWVKFFIGSHALEIIRDSEIPVLTIVPKDINFVSASF